MAEWKRVASDLVFGNWRDGEDDSNSAIKRYSDERKIMCLLIDIAESLRVLRCQNFKNIPTELWKIREAIRKQTKGSIMAMTGFERSVLMELKIITGNRKLKEKDLLEWNTNEVRVRENARDGEEVVHCKLNGVWCAIPKQIKKEDKKHGKK